MASTDMNILVSNYLDSDSTCYDSNATQEDRLDLRKITLDTSYSLKLTQLASRSMRQRSIDKEGLSLVGS
jgi:hypothetical protein